MKRSPSIPPSILHAYPGPSQSMQPHTITDPPPNFTVPSTSLSLSPSPALFQAHFLPSDPRQLILVSSDYTFFQSPGVQSLCLIAKSILSFLCFYDRRGFFFFTTAFIPLHLRCLHTVWRVTGWLVICRSAFEACTAVSALGGARALLWRLRYKPSLLYRAQCTWALVFLPCL